MSESRMSATLLVAVLVAGCELFGSLTAPRPETVVENRTGQLIIAGVDEGLNEGGGLNTRYLRFFAVPPGATIAVDTEGHHNALAQRISIFDVNCELLDEIAADFSDGGTIVVASGADISFQGGLKGHSGYPESGAPTTCEAAKNATATPQSN